MMGAVTGEPQRQVHHSDPHARTLAQVNAEFDRLAGRVLAGVLGGSLDPADAFALAAFLEEEGQRTPLVRELGEAAAAGTDPERLAGLSRELLVAARFGLWELEPELLATLEQALDVLRADVAATGLTGAVTLSVKDWNGHAYTEFRGCWGHGGGIVPETGRNPVAALAEVADDLQDAIMETIWAVWPVCPEHSLGGHARVLDGQAVWWCRSGHVIALVGQLTQRNGPDPGLAPFGRTRA